MKPALLRVREPILSARLRWLAGRVERPGAAGRFDPERMPFENKRIAPALRRLAGQLEARSP